jgi:hypothetical protein
MTLIIPGVEVTVVKEVVAPQLSPSGILGLVGITENADETRVPPVSPVQVKSWNSFIDQFGATSACSLPEAGLALANGVSELVIAPVNPGTAAPAKIDIPANTPANTAAMTITAKEAGTAANGLTVKITTSAGATGKSFDLTVSSADGKTVRNYSNLVMDQENKEENSHYVGNAVNDPQIKIDHIDAGSWPWDGTYTLVGVTADKPSGIDIPSSATAITVTARAAGPWANGIVVKITTRQVAKQAANPPDGIKTDGTKTDGTKTENVFDMTLSDAAGTSIEVYRNLVLDKNDPRYVATVLKSNASRLGVSNIKDGSWPKDGSYTLAGGADCTSAAPYIDALRLLEDDPDIDMVLVALQDFTNAAEIYGAVVSHCTRMAALSKGRIGFGQVPPASTIDTRIVDQWKTLVSNLVSDRFVLVAPNGAVAAVAGMTGSLDYFESPTFKTLTGVTALKPIRVEDQEALLQANIVPVITQRGRGTIVLRGLTTDHDQISVRRIADHAVRGVKMIGDLFIGRLNNERGRDALKQKLTEFLVQMERDGAIVPSTDGRDPAFKVNVYSSEDDFSKGIVRVDMAVRPVRAIDYIYATVLVQV